MTKKKFSEQTLQGQVCLMTHDSQRLWGCWEGRGGGIKVAVILLKEGVE